MLDLFDRPATSGLVTTGDFLTRIEESELITAIDGEQLSPFRFQQWTGKRLTKSFGWSYDFTTGALARAEPLPAWLDSIRDRAAAFANLAPALLVQALLIRYDPGAGIGWHRDRPIYEHVIGISLGASADMRLRRRDGNRWERRTFPLVPRGAYHLSGEARHDWEHSIADMASVRHSITFRSFSDRGRRIAASCKDRWED